MFKDFLSILGHLLMIVVNISLYILLHLFLLLLIIIGIPIILLIAINTRTPIYDVFGNYIGYELFGKQYFK